jgi:hypothetical protein
VIKRLSAVIVVLAVTSPVLPQEVESVRCVATLYHLRGEKWKLIKSEKFTPKIGEEELTNKTIPVPGTRFRLYASVFPTDESLGSAKGADSIQLAVAFSSKKLSSAFDLDNNAIAETTFATLDTLRVQRATYVNHHPIMARLECWDPRLERIAERP